MEAGEGRRCDVGVTDRMKNHRELWVMQLCISFPTLTMRTGEERANKEN